MKQKQYKTIQTQSKCFLFTFLPKRYKVEADLKANTQPGTVTLQKEKAILNKLNACKKPFSLIELIVAMVLFVFLMLIIVTMVTSTQETFSASVDRDNIYSNPHLAFDLISRDLQASLYEEDKVFFWQKESDEVSFVAISDSSQVCEVRYKLSGGAIQRSCVDPGIHTWNFYGNKSTGAWNAGNYQDIIPYVTGLKFTCFDKNGNKINSSPTSLTPYPYSVKVDITTLGANAYKKWQESAVPSFKDDNERTFSKTIYLGDR